MFPLQMQTFTISWNIFSFFKQTTDNFQTIDKSTATTYFFNLLSTEGSGVPKMSWILAIWSTSLEPGNRGCKLKYKSYLSLNILVHATHIVLPFQL